MGSEDKETQEGTKESKDLGQDILASLSSMRHLAVSALAHADYGMKKLKTIVAPVASFEGADRVLSPVQDLKTNIEQNILQFSSTINSQYPFLSSMAKSHQMNLSAQVGLGSGLISTLALRSIVKRRARLFLGVTLLMAADTYGLCELIKFEDHHKKVSNSK